MAILGKLSELDKTMIWYTYKADLNVIQNQFVQLSSDGLTVELHTTGAAIGICMTLETTEDTQEHLAQVYVAGGSGQDAVLNASWNGAPSRFEVINGKVNPVSSGGIGWIVPDFPQSSKSENDLVKVAIY